MARSILLIDDDELLLRLLGDIFDFHQIETVKASSGEMGIRLAKQCLPDLIICDIRLQDIYGLDVLARIQEDEAAADIPVIILTGCSKDEFNLSMSVYPSVVSTIRKPFAVENLINTVMTFMKPTIGNRATCCRHNSTPGTRTHDSQDQ